jgi:hypothetical protein
MNHFTCSFPSSEIPCASLKTARSQEAPADPPHGHQQDHHDQGHGARLWVRLDGQRAAVGVRMGPPSARALLDPRKFQCAMYSLCRDVTRD